MADKNLIAYITQAREAGMQDEVIKHALIQAAWPKKLIEEAFVELGGVQAVNQVATAPIQAVANNKPVNTISLEPVKPKEAESMVAEKPQSIVSQKPEKKPQAIASMPIKKAAPPQSLPIQESNPPAMEPLGPVVDTKTSPAAASDMQAPPQTAQQPASSSDPLAQFSTSRPGFGEMQTELESLQKEPEQPEEPPKKPVTLGDLRGSMQPLDPNPAPVVDQTAPEQDQFDSVLEKTAQSQLPQPADTVAPMMMQSKPSIAAGVLAGPPAKTTKAPQAVHQKPPAQPLDFSIPAASTMPDLAPKTVAAPTITPKADIVAPVELTADSIASYTEKQPGMPMSSTQSFAHYPAPSVPPKPEHSNQMIANSQHPTIAEIAERAKGAKIQPKPKPHIERVLLGILVFVVVIVVVVLSIPPAATP